MVTWLESVYLAYKYHIELRNFPIFQTLFGISLGKQTVMVQQKCQSNHAVPGHDTWGTSIIGNKNIQSNINTFTTFVVNYEWN